MSKLLTLLLAGVFAAGTALAQTAPATSSDKNTGTLSSSGTASGTGAATGTDATLPMDKSTTRTPRIGADSARSSITAPGAGSGATVSGDGTGKTSATGGSTGNTTATTGSKTGDSTAATGSKSGAATTGTMGAAGDPAFCPPGLDKKDNDCMPPGQAKKSGASSMDNKAMGSDKADGERAQDRTTKP